MGLAGFLICHILKKKGYRCRTFSNEFDSDNKESLTQLQDGKYPEGGVGERETKFLGSILQLNCDEQSSQKLLLNSEITGMVL